MAPRGSSCNSSRATRSAARSPSRAGCPGRGSAEIGQQIAAALAHAHAAGIVHRDLKPDNILLAGQRAIVTDFGIAQVSDATSKLTSAGTAIGTAHYMAPEQLEGATATAAADLWALGATLYAAIEGTPPFTAPTLAAVITGILTRTPSPPRNAGPLAELLARLLAKVPAQRPDAPGVARALEGYRGMAAAVAAGPPRPHFLPGVPGPSPRQSLRRRHRGNGTGWPARKRSAASRPPTGCGSLAAGLTGSWSCPSPSHWWPAGRYGRASYRQQRGGTVPARYQSRRVQPGRRRVRDDASRRHRGRRDELPRMADRRVRRIPSEVSFPRRWLR